MNKHFLQAFLLLFVLALFTGHIQASPSVNTNDNKQPNANKPLPANVYGELVQNSLFTISPSGNRIAYRNTKEDQNIITLIDLSMSAIIGEVDIETLNPSRLFFVDEDILLFSGSENVKRKRFIGQARADMSVAAAYNIKTKKLHQLLTAGLGISRYQTNLGSIFGLSKNKKYAYMMGLNKQNLLELFRVNITKQAVPRRVRKLNQNTINLIVDEEGEILVKEMFDNKNNIHTLESNIDGDWREIFREETEIPLVSFSGLLPDKKNIVVVKSDENIDRSAFYSMSLENGDMSETLFADNSKSIAGVYTDINNIAKGIVYSGFSPSYLFFDDALQTMVNNAKKSVPHLHLRVSDFTDDFKNIVFYGSGKNSSGDFFLYRDNKLSYLSSARPNIPGNRVHSVVDIEYQARDGMIIPNLVTLPKGKKLENLPAIIMPHGGPATHDTKDFDYWRQFFAEQGYLVIQPQFRGSTGFGIEHFRAGSGEWGRKMQTDLNDAINDLAAQGIIDKSKVCIIGISYGGYAALAGATLTPNTYQCAISINGVSDISKMMDFERERRGENHWVVSYWERTISNGEFDEDHLAAISPINHVDNVDIPILIIHGEFDTVVPKEQSEMMHKALLKAGKDSELIILEDGNHHLSIESNRIKTLQAIEKFLSRE